MAETRTLALDRGFKWIGPFFAALVPFFGWAFFFDDSPQRNIAGGVLCVAILALFAVYCHLTAVRTWFRVTPDGIESSSITGVRSARWTEIRFAAVEGCDLVFHLVSGQPIKASSYLNGFSWLVELARDRGLLRSGSEQPDSAS